MASQNDTQYSKFGNVIRNIQNKLGKRSLESDLKSTVKYEFAISLAVKKFEPIRLQIGIFGLFIGLLSLVCVKLPTLG